MPTNFQQNVANQLLAQNKLSPAIIEAMEAQHLETRSKTLAEVEQAFRKELAKVENRGRITMDHFEDIMGTLLSSGS